MNRLSHEQGASEQRRPSTPTLTSATSVVQILLLGCGSPALCDPWFRLLLFGCGLAALLNRARDKCETPSGCRGPEGVRIDQAESSSISDFLVASAATTTTTAVTTTAAAAATAATSTAAVTAAATATAATTATTTTATTAFARTGFVHSE